MLKDDGTRREYGTGAVRDTADGKGRCDLIPLDICKEILLREWPVDMAISPYILSKLELFQRTGNEIHLREAIKLTIFEMFNCPATAFLEVAKHYEDGAKKYAERNWEKGISTHCYLDSAVRHYLKWLRGDKDEPHDRAVLWNLIGLWWTVLYRPEMNDLPYVNKEEEQK